MNDRSLILPLLGIVGLLILVQCCWGSISIPLHRVMAALLGTGTPEDVLVVQSIRLPRALAALLTGGALGLSGAALQGLLRNPLAEPGVLGVTAASSFGGTLIIATGLVSFIPFGIPIATITGALLATLLLAELAYRLKSVNSLIIIGVTLSSFIGALMSLILSLAPNPFTLGEILNWSFGSVANRSWQDIALSLPGILFGGFLLHRARNGLRILTLGEDVAATSGLDLRRHRRLVIIGTGLATGGAVSLAGAIGFIGIIAPHAVRPWVQNDPGRTLLPSFLVGGIALMIADLFIRLLPYLGSIRLGVAVSIVGAPLFALIAAREARS
ncbi:MAG: iron ABC transporter permease [Pseudomonadota bacterium]